MLNPLEPYLTGGNVNRPPGFPQAGTVREDMRSCGGKFARQEMQNSDEIVECCCTRRLPLRHTLIKQLKQLTAAVVRTPTLRRRMIGLLIAYAIGTCVLGALVWEMRLEAIASGAKVLIAFAQLTEEQTTRTIQNVDQTLEIVEERLATAKREGATSAEQIRRELQELLASRPYLNGIAVTDRDGHVIYRSDAGTGSLNLGDRAYFLYHKEHLDAGFDLGSPIRTRASTKWMLPATRGREDTNGAFDGVIVGLVDPLFFVRVWSVDRAMPDQATALWANDGTVLIRSPFDERTMGTTLRNSAIVGQIRLGISDSTYRVVSQIDGQDRLVAYRRLASYPDFSLSVTQRTDRILAVWWRTAVLVAIGWAFSGAALAWLALKLTREVIVRSASDGRYRVLFNESPYPMLVADKESLRFVAVNDAAVQQYGWSEQEHLAMTIDDHYPPEVLPALRERRRKDGFALSRTLKGIRHRRKNGSIMDMEMAVRLIDFDGRPAYLAMAQDVGGRLSLERQLVGAQRMEVVGQLTGGIAHDFNNILMVILGNVDVLLEEKLTPAATERLDHIGEAVDKAATLTRQLLAFSRKQPLRPQATDLNALVTETGQLLRRALGVQIEVDSVLADDVGTIDIDRSQLETALVNLCLNARDAMPDGGRVLIETRNVILDDDYVAMNPEAVAGSYAMLEVSDAGYGISSDALPKVFEPFFTTKEVGKGSGLGLSMIYGFIHQSNGHVKIYSEVGVGTSVRLYLPCILAPGDRHRAENAAAVPVGTEHILVVEDEPRVRANVVGQLRSLGYVVSEADNGLDGLAAMEAIQPTCDLLLTDIVMPGPMNGRSLADKVVRRWPKTKVVFMSGFSEASVVHRGQLDRGVLLLSKPFRKGALAQILRRALDASSARPTAGFLAA